LASVDALKQHAARHGRSAEAEHRAILEEVLLGIPKKSFAEALASMPNVGQDADFERLEVQSVSIGKAGSGAHSNSEPSYTATLLTPNRVSTNASLLAAMAPPQ
jgi:plasmid stability protein